MLTTIFTRHILGVFSALLLFAVLAAAQNGKGYHLIDKIQIGGEGGWDYIFVDSDAHRLYISHATRVVVVDTDTDKVVGEIAGLKGIHGIATAGEFGRGFISDGRDNSVVIFDLKTLKTLDTVKVGTNPDCIMYDPATKRVFAFNRSSSSATAIDAKDGKVAATFDLGGHPEFATSDGKGMVYVNLDDKSEVVVIDSQKAEVKTRYSLAPEGEDPSGMAIDRKNHRLFVVCGNKKMVVLDAESGTKLAALPIGEGVDAAGFDDNGRLAFASNGEGTLTVVSEDSKDKFSVVENVTTQRRARTMAVDHRTHKIYLPTAQFGEAPAPTAETPRPRPPMIPNTFVVLVFGK